MALKQPESMGDVYYFTRRNVFEKGKIMAWVLKKTCPKCKKEVLSKPINEKTGRPKVRSKIYVCPSCGYEESEKDVNNTVKMSIKYTCPYCEFEGETEIPYKRRTFMGAKAFVFSCDKCKEKIPLTKKMKKVKKPKSAKK